MDSLELQGSPGRTGLQGLLDCQGQGVHLDQRVQPEILAVADRLEQLDWLDHLVAAEQLARAD